MPVRTEPHPWVSQFRDRVGVALQATAAHGPGTASDRLVEAGRLADRHGYDAFFLGDHPAWAPECWTHLAVVAALTTRVRLGQMVAAAPYRTPLMTARLQSDLDAISRGRSVLGLGSGWNANDYGLGSNEFARMGIPYPPARQRQAALEEYVAIVRGLWSGTPFTFEGEHLRVADAAVTPPPQPGGVPLVIAGGGPRTLAQVARLADACNFGPGPAGNVDTPGAAADRFATLRAACREVGRPYDAILRSHFTHWLIVAPTAADVRRKVDRYFPDGLDAFWGAYLVAGTPDEVAAHYREYAAVGVQYFVVQTLDPTDEESIALAAQSLGALVPGPN